MSASDKSDKGAAGAIAPGRAEALGELVSYGEGAIVSRTVAKGAGGTLTVFAFDQGQELSEHSAPFDAYVYIIDGQAVLTIGGDPVEAKAGSVVLMPANIPHAVTATQRFKMMLVMFKEGAPKT